MFLHAFYDALCNTVHASAAAGLMATLPGRKNWPPSCRELLPLSQFKGWHIQQQKQSKTSNTTGSQKTLHMAYCNHGCLYHKFCIPMLPLSHISNVVRVRFIVPSLGDTIAVALVVVLLVVDAVTFYETLSFGSDSKPWLYSF